jgi:HK97 family phage major capsid protein
VSDTTTIDPTVSKHVAERGDLLTKIEFIKAQAAERGKDLDDDDLDIIKTAQVRVKRLDNIIETLAVDLEMSEEMRNRLSRTAPHVVPQEPKYRTAGEIMWDCVHANFGQQHDREDREAKGRWERVMTRAAQHMGTTAAATTPTAGGFGGLYVAPVVGPVLDISPRMQPFLDYISQPAPNSITFSRPRISDPDFATGAGLQALQKAELASKKFDVAVDNLTLATYGGYLNVSQQLLSLAPGAWDIILTQLQRRVAWQAEAAAVTALYGGTVNKITLASGAAVSAVWGSLVQAARLVAQTTLEPATWMLYGPLGWERLASLTDTTGRPLFPALGPTNAFGQARLGDTDIDMSGIRSIYSTGVTTSDIWIGNSYGLEVYRYNFPVLESPEPSVFGRQVAVAQAIATYKPDDQLGATIYGAVQVGP